MSIQNRPNTELYSKICPNTKVDKPLSFVLTSS